ncbi:hypothetical protein PACTADRAFT_35808 [Pachysolen tannophilus NRRL Y-2460]|uniref:HTH CENPB-type domain-containing protein n=1 Tax=Pachysolen tannophilus NRRL Y-2460 TaxID=669874 RepID=A0A1E4TN25_PACTA|nr:hypothetical protein PACTADRAFT_35808 [Pachysolen tannophilus NRRL Y-2460]
MSDSVNSVNVTDPQLLQRSGVDDDHVVNHDHGDNNNSNSYHQLEREVEENNLEDEEDISSRLPRATLQQKIDVLDWHHNSEKKTQLQTVKYFSRLNEFAITKSTLNRWILTEDKLREDYKNLSLNNNKTYKTKPKFKYPEANRCLEIYYDQSLNENLKLTERFLISKWKDFYKNYHNLSDREIAMITTKSNGWLHYFKKRHQIKKEVTSNFYKDSKLFGIKDMRDEKLRIRNELLGYKPHQIYQFDEISIRTDFPIFGLNSSNQNTNSDNDNDNENNASLSELSIGDPSNRVIVGILGNASGINQLSPLIITDVRFKDQQLIQNLYFSNTGLLSTEIVYHYIKKLNEIVTEPIVLLMDNLYQHLIPGNELSKIKIVYFSPNLNSLKYYPLDFGVLRIFKCHIKDTILQVFLKKLMLDFAKPKDFTISKPDLISIISDSWELICYNKNLFVQCFKNSNLLPPLNYNDHNNLEKDLSIDVNTFKKKLYIVKDVVKESKILSLLKIFSDKNFIRSNYTMDSFLFPKEEKVVNFHLKDEDIIALVRKEFSISEDDIENGGIQQQEQQTNNDVINNSNFLKSQSNSSFNVNDQIFTKELCQVLIEKYYPYFNNNQLFNNTEVAIQFNRFFNSFIKFSNKDLIDQMMNNQNLKMKVERKLKRDENIARNELINDFNGTSNKIDFFNNSTRENVNQQQQRHIQNNSFISNNHVNRNIAPFHVLTGHQSQEQHHQQQSQQSQQTQQSRQPQQPQQPHQPQQYHPHIVNVLNSFSQGVAPTASSMDIVPHSIQAQPFIQQKQARSAQHQDRSLDAHRDTKSKIDNNNSNNSSNGNN